MRASLTPTHNQNAQCSTIASDCSNLAKPPPGVRALVAVRDPRDVCVSLYFHSRALKAVSYSGSWSAWLDLFLAAGRRCQ